jgi:hypothetical protein
MAAARLAAVCVAALGLSLLGCRASKAPFIVAGEHILGVAGNQTVVCRIEQAGTFSTPRWTVIVQDVDGFMPVEILVVQSSWRGGPGYPNLLDGFVTDEAGTYSLHLESLRLITNRYPTQVLLR